VALFDLSQLTFDEFVSFLFDHDIDTEEHWYDDPELSNFNDFNEKGVAAPQLVVAHMTRLFRDFAAIASRYSSRQINAGIWAMFSYGPFRLQKHLWLASAPLLERVACVRAMYRVYSDYVAKSTVEVMENCFNMWWDAVASGFWDQMYFDHKIADGDVAALTGEQKALLDEMFDTLSRILALPDWRTQACALHGLGHLHHPGVRDRVQRFLDENRAELSPEGIAWVERCRDGTVM
jgi:hypothetical protein